jgi:hypothetical protein
MLLGWRRLLPERWLYLGCLLPDLIDKPLYYLLGPTSLLSGTRTFGHTGLFLLAWILLALFLRRPWCTALAAGIATHFVLDIAGELFTGVDPESSIWLAIFYPAWGRFPQARFANLWEHLFMTSQRLFVVAGEVIGGALLVYSRLKRKTAL